jgi:folate-binding protein YgfZ
LNQLTANKEFKQYKSLIESCGLIRFNNIGVIYAKGDDVLDLIDRLSTNDVSKLEDNFWVDTVLTTNKGRIVSQIRLLKSSSQILIVSDISVVSKIIEWIDFYTFSEDVEFKNITENASIYSLIGPSANLVIKKIINSSNIMSNVGNSIPVDMDGKNLILNFDQIGGIPKVDLILDKNLNEPLMNLIRQQNISEVTPNIYNIFRIENRFPMHGSELVDKYNPLEANLLDNISFNKGCYVGQEVVARLNAYDKVRMQLVFLYLDKNCDPATDMAIISGSNQVGVLTSFEFSSYADK